MVLQLRGERELLRPGLQYGKEHGQWMWTRAGITPV